MTFSLRHFSAMTIFVLGGILPFSASADERSGTYNNYASMQSGHVEKTNTRLKKVRNDRTSPAHALTRYLTQHEKNNNSAGATLLVPTSLPKTVTTAH